MRLQAERPRSRVTKSKWLFVSGLWLVAIVALARLGMSERSWAPYLTVVGVVLSAVVSLRLAHVTLESLTTGTRLRSFATLAGVVVAVTLGAALVRLPAALKAGYDGLVAPDETLAQADVDPLNNMALSSSLVAAAKVIPRNATYAVLSTTYHKPPWVFNLWLMPRIQVPVNTGARWLIVYVSPIPPGLRYVRRFVVVPGIDVLELSR